MAPPNKKATAVRHQKTDSAAKHPKFELRVPATQRLMLQGGITRHNRQVISILRKYAHLIIDRFTSGMVASAKSRRIVTLTEGTARDALRAFQFDTVIFPKRRRRSVRHRVAKVPHA
jgi:hypothetical protein